MTSRRALSLATACVGTVMSLASCGKLGTDSTVTNVSILTLESNDTVVSSSPGFSKVKIATLDQPVDAASRKNEKAIYFVGRLGKKFSVLK